MKVLIFLVTSAIYALVASFIWIQILLSCGLGPDSPAACNDRADHQAAIFAGIAIIVYGLFVIVYWRFRRPGVR